jgi:hypothetical protein
VIQLDRQEVEDTLYVDVLPHGRFEARVECLSERCMWCTDEADEELGRLCVLVDLLSSYVWQDLVGSAVKHQ